MNPAVAGFCLCASLMDYKRYDIVIIPPPEIREQAITLSQALAPLGTFFVLDDTTRYPHISLYHVPLQAAVLPDVIETLGRVARETPSFILRQGTYYPDQGVWVGVRYVADKPILDLHATVIDATKGFRTIEDDARYKARWAELSPKQRKNIEECGWADAYTRYSPHLTFSKLRAPRADVLAHLPQREFSFRVGYIGLFELGENGTCVRLIAQFQLEGEQIGDHHG